MMDDLTKEYDFSDEAWAEYVMPAINAMRPDSEEILAEHLCQVQKRAHADDERLVYANYNPGWVLQGFLPGWGGDWEEDETPPTWWDNHHVTFCPWCGVKLDLPDASYCRTDPWHREWYKNRANLV